MNTQQKNWNIPLLLLLPFAFILFVGVFGLPDAGTQTHFVQPTYVVSIAAIVLVSIVGIACICTALIASQPRYDW